MKDEADEHEPDDARLRRPLERHRADGRERHCDMPRAMPHGDERAGGRGGCKRTDDDRRRFMSGAHDPKQASLGIRLKGATIRSLASLDDHRYLVVRMHPAAQVTTILVVEDSPNLVALLQEVLGDQGYRVRVARDGESGLASALEDEPDLLLLDIGLPHRNGIDVVRELRRKGVNAPALMLTGRTEVADRVLALEAGADDYLGKPFAHEELIARVRALLRRASGNRHASRLCVGEVMLDPVQRNVFRGDRQLVLTQREFSLLEFFMRNAGRPLARAEIAQRVWRHTPVDQETNIVDVYVAYLRKKLDTEADPPMIHTVRGVGYILRP